MTASRSLKTGVGLLLLALQCGAPPASAAGFATGNGLYQDLTSADPFTRGTALGYIAGVADAGETGPVQGFRFCLSSRDITAGQLRDIVKRYLDQYPAERHDLASRLTAKALAQAFPCRP